MPSSWKAAARSLDPPCSHADATRDTSGSADSAPTFTRPTVSHPGESGGGAATALASFDCSSARRHPPSEPATTSQATPASARRPTAAPAWRRWSPSLLRFRMAMALARVRDEGGAEAVLAGVRSTTAPAHARRAVGQTANTDVRRRIGDRVEEADPLRAVASEAGVSEPAQAPVRLGVAL